MAGANILVDTGFWIGLYTPENPISHQTALSFVDILEDNRVIIPWPTLYEFVNTRLARRKDYLYAFQQFIQKPNVERISDEPYKSIALQNIFELNRTRIFSISLVDEVIRQMLMDDNLKIDYLLTFNKGDFEYSCQVANVLILE